MLEFDRLTDTTARSLSFPPRNEPQRLRPQRKKCTIMEGENNFERGGFATVEPTLNSESMSSRNTTSRSIDTSQHAVEMYSNHDSTDSRRLSTTSLSRATAKFRRSDLGDARNLHTLCSSYREHWLTEYSHTGQHSQNPPDLLQGQGVPQAHPAQGHPVQGWQGEKSTTPLTRPISARPTVYVNVSTSSGLTFPLHNYRPLCTPRVSAVTTGSRAVTVVRPSPSSTRRPRPPRRLSSVLSALPARPRSSSL